MTFQEKQAAHFAFIARPNDPARRTTTAYTPPEHRLPPLTKGLFDNLFRLDARRTTVSNPEVQFSSLVPLFRNPEFGEPQ